MGASNESIDAQGEVIGKRVGVAEIPDAV